MIHSATRLCLVLAAQVGCGRRVAVAVGAPHAPERDRAAFLRQACAGDDRPCREVDGAPFARDQPSCSSAMFSYLSLEGRVPPDHPELDPAHGNI